MEPFVREFDSHLASFLFIKVSGNLYGPITLSNSCKLTREIWNEAGQESQKDQNTEMYETY